MIDDEEADDKIVAVLDNDLFFNSIQDISALPQALLDRLTHYFATYKLVPGVHTNVRIEKSYGREHAEAVMLASMADYEEAYAETPPTLRF